MFSFIEDDKVNIELSLEDLLKYSYGMLQKRKATQIIEKEFGHTIFPISVSTSQDMTSKKKSNKYGDDLSASMMCLGLEAKDQMITIEDKFKHAHRRSSFEKIAPATLSNRQYNYGKVEERRNDTILNDTPTLIPLSNNSQSRKMTKKINFSKMEEFKEKVVLLLQHLYINF